VASLLLVVAVSSAALTDIETSVGNVLAVYAPTPTPSPTGTPAPQNGGVVINEINWVGSNGDGLDEWVELYNTTGAPVDLTNWVIENLGTGNALPNRDVVITSGIIPAGGYFLISNHDEDDSRVNVIPDLVTSNVSLNNGGEQLVLKDDGGVIIDTANGLGTWFAGSSATPKKTMERINPAGPGTDQLNWQTASTHTGMDDSGDTDEFGTPKNVNGL
jgi:hypothetical protein